MFALRTLADSSLTSFMFEIMAASVFLENKKHIDQLNNFRII